MCEHDQCGHMEAPSAPRWSAQSCTSQVLQQSMHRPDISLACGNLVCALQMWRLLQHCRGIESHKHLLPSWPTLQEMTAGEPKFEERVDLLLAAAPNPVARQLCVEALAILGTLAENFAGELHNVQTMCVHVSDTVVQIGSTKMCCALTMWLHQRFV
jgi:hypothetical protein